jgi:hypothetical protein
VLSKNLFYRSLSTLRFGHSLLNRNYKACIESGALGVRSELRGGGDRMYFDRVAPHVEIVGAELEMLSEGRVEEAYHYYFSASHMKHS